MNFSDFNKKWFSLDADFSSARRVLFNDPRWVYGPLFIKDTVKSLVNPMGNKLINSYCCDLGCGVSNVLGNLCLLFLNGAGGGYAFDLLPPRDVLRSSESLYDLLVACLIAPSDFHLNTEFSRDEFIKRIHMFDLIALRDGNLAAGVRNVDIKYETRDIYELPSNLGMFDLTFSRAVLEHFPDAKKAINKIFLHTAPGGIHLHAIDFYDHRYYKSDEFLPWSFLSQDNDWCVGIPDADWSNRLRPSEFKEIFLDIGFDVLNVSNTSSPIPDEIYQNFTNEFKKFSRKELEIHMALFHLRKGS